jgi:hypothetical protein
MIESHMRRQIQNDNITIFYHLHHITPLFVNPKIVRVQIGAKV